MILQPPNIDDRSGEEVSRQTVELIKLYAPEWKEFDPVTARPAGVSAALIGAFARFTEIIIQRLNQAPQKNFLAFLDMLGASLLPPQPARAPLTFSLAAGSAVDGLVPEGTPSAAPPVEGEKAPVIFETERELVVVAAQLASLFVRDPAQDKYADLATVLSASSEELIFQGNQPTGHILYLGHDRALGFAAIDNLSLDFKLPTNLSDTRTLAWEAWDGAEWKSLAVTDDTNGLQQSGLVKMGAMKAIPPVAIDKKENRWLRCRLLTPVSQDTQMRSAMERALQLPNIDAIRMIASINRSGLAADAAFTDQTAIDLSKEFFPLGEKPGFGTTFWLAQSEAISTADARIVINITLANPPEQERTTPRPVRTDGEPVLTWEIWDGAAWVEMGTSSIAGPKPAEPDTFKFVDTTHALTREKGVVSFTLPKKVAAATANGVENFWIRARLTSGHYGQEARYQKKGDGFEFIEATFAPPIIKSLAVNYHFTLNEAPEAVLTFNDFLYDDATAIVNLPGKPVAPFRAMEDRRPTFYLGFTLPQDRAEFPNRKISLYCRTADIRYGEKTVPLAPDSSQKIGAVASTVSHFFTLTNDAPTAASFTLRIIGSRWPSLILEPSPVEIDAGKSKEIEVQVTIPGGAPSGESDSGFIEIESTVEAGFKRAAVFTTFAEKIAAGERLRLVWEYWDGRGWSKLTVRDDTENFTRPGLVEFLAPADFAPRREFDLSARYWLRVRLEEGRYDFAPRLRRALLNTTLASQTVTVRNEILGSSDGSASQKFRAARAPVLAGQRLEVREVETPSASELDKIAGEEGIAVEQAVSISRDAASRPRDIWVRWHEVSDFYASGPRDRHYVMDHLTGEIRFGDGLRGLIPPSGAGNLRLARYRTGGGSAGNRAANTIVQLKTTIPYIDKVTNTEAAEGGADAESLDSLLTRMPREIRHRRRAVTVEDYEDLALIASPAVARSRAVPLRNLARDPLGKEPTVLGEASVIIVPRSKEAKPLPSLELINRVKDYLEARMVPTASLFVVGPLYVRVDVTAEIALRSIEGASAVEQAVERTLAAFLHPLTGGLEGEGWDFGRKPHRSDLFALIESIEGVDHIRRLDIAETEDQPGVTATGRFLVYSGKHTIRLVFQ
jgi:hypothetical protein